MEYFIKLFTTPPPSTGSSYSTLYFTHIQTTKQAINLYYFAGFRREKQKKTNSLEVFLYFYINFFSDVVLLFFPWSIT